MKKIKIKRNAIKCKHCGQVIESKSRHDLQVCQCGRVAVDGGKEYLRRLGNIDGYTELSEYEERD